MKKYCLIITVLFTAVITLACTTAPAAIEDHSAPTAQQYSKYYGLEFPGITHNLDFINADEFKIALHSFQPSAPAGTVIIIHGYYDHTGLEKNLIRELLKQHLTVVAFDLPGHGLSSGPRASIESFSQYSEVLRAVTEITLKDCPQPQHIIGHSTGASIIIDCALHEKLDGFSKLILVSPLVHINFWDAAKIGNFLAGIFTDEMPRGFRKNSSDQAYLSFIRNEDPLQYRGIPLQWYDALIEWNEEIADLQKSDQQILILQGRSDKIVDFDYNLKFINEKFPNSSTIFIDNAKHQLFNETPKLRMMVFSEIIKYLL
jgi:alpha-beta hydrolase superfamily lysophospholipase